MRTHQRILSSLALSTLLLASCGDDGGPADAAPVDALPAAGTFSLAWSISDGTNALTCDDVGAISLSVTVIKQGSSGGSVDAFACESGTAVSRQFAPGTYNMTIDLRASGSRSLIAAPVQVRDIEIVVDGVTPLPDQSFVIAPTGGFSFMVDAQATAGNCETVDNSGAGIVGFEFALKDETDACVAATFDVAAGASGAAGSYTSVCPTPGAAHACIDADQLVTVNPIESGPLVLTVTGHKDGPIDCYDRVSNFTVAGAMLQTELGTLATSLLYSAECDPNFIMVDAGL